MSESEGRLSTKQTMFTIIDGNGVCRGYYFTRDAAEFSRKHMNYTESLQSPDFWTIREVQDLD